MKLETSRCIESGWDCFSAHSLTQPRSCLIILEKVFSLDDLGGLYVVRVDMWHGFEGFFPLAWLSFGFHLRAVFWAQSAIFSHGSFVPMGLGPACWGQGDESRREMLWLFRGFGYCVLYEFVPALGFCAIEVPIFGVFVFVFVFF